MTTSSDLTLSIDAHGQDDTHITTHPVGTEGSRQLIVRVGTVLVHCLDGASTMSAGLAWATARLQARTWLPDLDDHPDPWPQTTPAKAATTGYGVAYPTGSILFDGRQRWQVTPRDMTLAVTVGPLTVNVHDWTALDTHVRAWTEATAIATRLFPGKSLPFNQLVNEARRGICRDWDDKANRRSNSERKPDRRPQQRPDRSRDGREHDGR